jgi:hypothetical protein
MLNLKPKIPLNIYNINEFVFLLTWLVSAKSGILGPFPSSSVNSIYFELDVQDWLQLRGSGFSYVSGRLLGQQSACRNLRKNSL